MPQVKITARMKTGERRLHLLANLLDSPKVDLERFDMEHWGVTTNGWKFWRNKLKPLRRLLPTWIHHPDADDYMHFMEVPLKNVCGTSACALGTATLVPEIYKAGLRLVADEYIDKDFKFTKGLPSGGDMILRLPNGTYHGTLGAIAQALFGINNNRAAFLFYGQRTPEQEAALIRTVIAEIKADEGFMRTEV